MARILIAEDDPGTLEQLKDLLEAANHIVETATNGVDALEYLRSVHFDLVILDWNMPGLVGVDVCKAYRGEGGKSPVLMLTANAEINEKECGFESGADDYLVKPYNFRELMARVKALLRRPASFTGTTIQLGSLNLDTNSHTVTLDGETLKLLPLEFALLEFLMKRPGQPFSAEALLDRVWSSDAEPSPETVRTYIKTLRRKIKSDAGGPKISTVYGIGYKIES